MKISITLIILGAFIAAACYFIQEYGVITSFTFPDFRGEGASQGLLEFKAKTATIVARGLAVAGIAFGLVVLHLGIIQVRRIRKSEYAGLGGLAGTQAVLGAAIVLATWLIIRWGFSSGYSAIAPDGLIVHAFSAPTRYKIEVQIISGLVFLAGLGVFGCGVGQFLKGRRSRNPDSQSSRE